MGAAALLVLAEYAQETSFHLNKNLLLLFTPSMSVDENYGAYRKFLDSWADRISHGIVIRGTDLGIMESRQIGGYRLSLTVKTPETDLLSAGSSASAAAILGSIAFQLGGVSADAKESAVVSIARMESGIGYGHWSSEGSMNIEILSEDQRILEAMTNLVRGTITRAGAGAELDLKTRSRRSMGDAARNARMMEALRATLSSLKVKQEDGVISEKVALLNDRSIPAAAVGMAKGKKTFDEDYVETESILPGFRQLLIMIERCAELHGAKEEDKR
jgi:metal-dependent amidase/aminoacylase/carboxypeptidase family protein